MLEVKHQKRLPAEWEHQAAILLTWPHEKGGWGKDYRHVEQTFITIAQSLSSHQNVIIGAENDRHQTEILSLLKQHSANMTRIFSYITPSNDVWARDHGPITVYEEGIPTLYDFRFNGWGNKYDASLDDEISQHLFESHLLKGYAFQKIDFILEGGSIESDGLGTLLTTSQCLQHKERNFTLSKKELEKKFTEFFGISTVLWLDHGMLLGDDTDGHIDTLARFINPHTIAYVCCEDKTDPQFEALKQMEQNLKTFKDSNNQPYDLIPLPLPRAVFDQEGKRLPATYANFLITNHQILVPTYQDPCDTFVLNLFKKCFPHKTIVGIDCLPIIEQYGSLHCLTMQIPAPLMRSQGE